MAPRRRRLLRSNSSVLVSVCVQRVGYLVFRFDVKRLFSNEDDERPREVLPLPPSPVVCFRRPLNFPMSLAASSSGGKIVAATTDGHIMVYDATRSQCTYDHDLGRWKPWPVLFAAPLSSSRPSSSSGAGAGAGAESRRRRRRRDDDMSMVVATRRPNVTKPAEPYFEAVRLTSGGRLQSLPVPPPLVLGGDLPLAPANDSWRYDYRAEVRSYFMAGGRVWLSVWCDDGVQGTYSLDMDMAARTRGEPWRREGSWVLPFQGRAVYAPDLGLLLGFKYGLIALCAIDMRPQPVVIRQQWMRSTLLPDKDEGYSPEEDYCFCFGGLAYLGRGKLCISWSGDYEGKRRILALTAVDISVTMTNNTSNNEGPPELLLRKRRSRCYLLPRTTEHATVLPLL